MASILDRLTMLIHFELKTLTVLCSHNRNLFTFVDIWKFSEFLFAYRLMLLPIHNVYTLQTTFSVTKIMSKRLSKSFTIVSMEILKESN